MLPKIPSTGPCLAMYCIPATNSPPSAMHHTYERLLERCEAECVWANWPNRTAIGFHPCSPCLRSIRVDFLPVAVSRRPNYWYANVFVRIQSHRYRWPLSVVTDVNAFAANALCLVWPIVWTMSTAMCLPSSFATSTSLMTVSGCLPQHSESVGQVIFLGVF